MIHLVIASWFWHPLAEGHGSTCSASNHSGCGYSFWSGAGSDIAEITLLTAVLASLIAWYRKHNCHIHRCWRLQWHPHPDHGHPVCAVHHPDGHHGTWWRIFHRKPHPRDHFLSASLHGYDHTRAPDHVQQFAGQSSNVSVTGSALGTAVDVVVGEATPEKPKKKRVRKPGTESVTDLNTKRPRDA